MFISLSFICRQSRLLYFINKFAMALSVCLFALDNLFDESTVHNYEGGAVIGAITGAIKGQTTETGFSRGLSVGAISGAITAVQLLELIANGEPFSKVALLRSLLNGKIFMDWVSPALLKAYHWQASAIETSLREFSDIFDVNTHRGLTRDSISELPVHAFESTRSGFRTTCAICLQDMKEGECGKSLPRCKHLFHVHCIDKWLIQQGSCPICRKYV